ncbi:hypothetical protein [Adhaeribacter soli]|uniref:DUF4595 domain-containing protein n=1 Tax=Adhaeribacter soli TaxID=2607655 RepID=A0A5N1J7I4_9BACT|nr:hypothetical protein [Adhaeribacter soli]KAA9340681.1 hypothetical protein F0P94_04435 [Adhaeribacter soli]
MRKLILLFLFLPFLNGCSKDDGQGPVQKPTISPNYNKCLLATIDDARQYGDFTYDTQDRLIGYKNRSKIQPYSYKLIYDSNNRIIRTNSYLDTTLIHYSLNTYSPAGLLAKTTNYSPSGMPANVVVFEYNSSNQLSKMTCTDSTILLFYKEYFYTNNTLLEKVYGSGGATNFQHSREYEFGSNKHIFDDFADPLEPNKKYPGNVVKYTFRDNNNVVVANQSYTTQQDFNQAGYLTKSVNTTLAGKVFTDLYTYNCK